MIWESPSWYINFFGLFRALRFKQCNSNYYDKLLYLRILLVSFAHSQFINWWYFALVSAQAKHLPATYHNKNGEAITSTQCYKERYWCHIVLQNTRSRMMSCRLQAEDSYLHARMLQPFLLPGGCFHYTWCCTPKLGYPWLLKQTPSVFSKITSIGWVGGTNKRWTFDENYFCKIVKTCRLSFTIQLLVLLFFLDLVQITGISFEWPVRIQCLDIHSTFGSFNFKSCNSNYYYKLLHLRSLLVSCAHSLFINWWYFDFVSAEDKKIPATSHNQNRAVITIIQCYKERCGCPIVLWNTCLRMTSCGLQSEDSYLHSRMPQPFLLPGGYFHYTWCWPPKLGYPWLLKHPPPY